MNRARNLIFIAICCEMTACGSEPKRPPVAPSSGTDGLSARATPANTDSKTPTRAEIRISEDIRRACGIADADAKFAFDSAKVEHGYYPVLEKLATCFTKGKLSGKQMRLVGHADPRGETEYNLLLGGHRADNVKTFLVRVGMGAGQIATSSRGEYEARGSDEGSWAEDRRVDVLLAN